MNNFNPADLFTGDVFTKTYNGVYGKFTPSGSSDVEYLLANITLNDIADIKTAADLTEFDNVTFEEIIQRDIDYKRVDEDLIAHYLQKQDGGVRFFPPLLISIIPGDTSHASNAVSEIIGTKFITTLGGDGFRLELNLTTNQTGHTVNHEGRDFSYVPFASIKINPLAVKLVVIDGQHRFEALRRMSTNAQQRQFIEKIEVPVCIFFTRRDLSDEIAINRDLRELFVTINSKQKDVSGHFIVLLDDKKISSHIVRSLANRWKKQLLLEGRSALPLLEWNTRDTRSAYQRQKKYSISTVSIIADCFSKYLFADSKRGFAHTLLKPKELRQVLGSTGEFDDNLDDIDDESFSQEQLDALKPYIEKRIVTSLDILFTESRPYKDLIASFVAKLKDFEYQASGRIAGISYYLDEVLYKYRRCTKGDQQAPRDAEVEFERAIKMGASSDGIFFKLIFQQALIRGWALLSSKLSKYEIEPASVAEAMVSALDALCFVPEEEFFDPNHSYTQRVLYDGQRIIQNDNSREAWIALMLGTLANEKAKKAFMMRLSASIDPTNIEAIRDDIVDLGRANVVEYLEKLLTSITSDLRKNWRFRELSRADEEVLTDSSKDLTKKDLFDKTINDIARLQHREAVKALKVKLSISSIEISV